MAESMMDSNDIVCSLSEFEGLETIEAELDILDQASHDNIRVVRSDEMEIIPAMIGKSDISEIKEEMDEEDLQEDEDMNESMTADMIVSNEMIHEMMHDDDVEMHDDEQQEEEQEYEGDARESEEHEDDQEDLNSSDDQHRLFSEGVIGDEEIIDDSQIITEDVGDVHHLLSRGHIHDEQILEDNEVKYLDDIMNDDVNETIIEAAEVEDRTGDPEGAYRDDDDEDDGNQGMEVNRVPSILTMDHFTDEIITGDTNPVIGTDPIEIVHHDVKPDITHIDSTPIIISSEPRLFNPTKTEKPDEIVTEKLIADQRLPPLTVVSKSDAQVQEAVKSITSGLYVMNSSGTATPFTHTLVQGGGTLIAPKETKISRVMTIPNIEASSGQTIRIVAPAGKFNSTAKAITLAQARQMGLISPSGRINNILPSTAKAVATTQQLGIKQLVVPATTKKTVTVVKSPTKILPAPPATGHKPQKVLIRQASTLKTGTIVTSGSAGHPTGTHMIRIPANQTLQQILPGGSKQVQYVKLVSGGTKGQTLVPVSLSKSIPVLTTNLLNSPTTTFKVVPMSTQAGSSSSPGQRVFIPASAVNSTQSQGISQSQIVMLPSHLLQQVKKGDCKLVPAVSSGGISSLRTTSTINGNRKVVPAPPVPPIKPKDPIPIAVSTPMRVVSTVTSASGSVQAISPSSLTTATSPVTPPPLLPAPAVTPLTPPGPQTSPQAQVTTVSPQGCSDTPASGSPPSPVNASIPQPKMEVKQEQWSGDESYFEANGIRPRKPCNCTKSMCLKLYCDCFANGEFCFQCNCTFCYNNLEHEEERQRAIKSCLERNPTAFRPKIGKTLAGSEERRHNRGCNCKRSGCLKNYCECFEAKIPCSKNCKCAGCKNTEMYPHGRRDEERTRYRMDSKSYDPHPGHIYTSACRQAFSMMSPELIQATCQCLIAQAEKWESPSEEREKESEQAQKLIIEEFGHCLVQIIDCVTKSIPQQAPVSSS
uniref:CRC domain-containing protein n=2 Tax=Lygus hesperus TaxID=30085 RepID=A0A0A9Z5L8_LYGHE